MTFRAKLTFRRNLLKDLLKRSSKVHLLIGRYLIELVWADVRILCFIRWFRYVTAMQLSQLTAADRHWQIRLFFSQGRSASVGP